MKWGRAKKPLKATSSSSPLSSRSSSVMSRVFPISWLSSKFKQQQQPAKSEPGAVALSSKLKQNMILSLKDETFYGGTDEDDGFWRLSFGEDGVDQLRKCGSLFKSEQVVDHRENELEILRRKDDKLFTDMVSDIRKVRQEVPADIKGLPNFKDAEVLTTQREKGLRPRKSQKKQDQLELKPILTIRTSERNKPEFKNSGSSKVSDYNYTKPRNSDERDGKEEDLQKNRRSLYISRRASSSIVNVQSPRTSFKVEPCKIKAIEDMKKAKMVNQKKKIRDDEERKRFESFAIVKHSFNVQQDFRDSMVEMITEKGISQPGELEDLLACYLTLNSDDCHELIIKVFRQVWFDLNHACSPELECKKVSLPLITTM